jgi:hypothetical protein
VLWPFSWVLVVRSQFINLILSHSFGHNLSFKSSNEEYEPTSNIYTSRFFNNSNIVQSEHHLLFTFLSQKFKTHLVGLQSLAKWKKTFRNVVWFILPMLSYINLGCEPKNKSAMFTLYHATCTNINIRFHLQLKIFLY